MVTLNSIEEVIEKLGGMRAVGELTGRGSTAVWNWKDRGFPAKTYKVMKSALEERGFVAPDELWDWL